jgi:signal transduction histidine kinase
VGRSHLGSRRLGHQLSPTALDAPAPHGRVRTRQKPLPVLIGGLLLLGALLVTCLFFLPNQGLLNLGFSAPVGLAGLIALAAFAELAYVRVPHGDITEDLTFFEAIVVMAALVLPPLVVITGALGGLVLAWIFMRRAWVKTVFNVGMFAAATSTMLIVAHAIGGQHHLGEVDLRLVLALMAGTAAFGAVNLLALAAVVHVVEGVPPLGWLRAEILGSLVMVGGNVGVAVIFVSMAMSSPILLPFVGLPVLALVHSFKQSQRHARERERANALVELSSALTASGDLDELIDGLLAPLRKVFDADRATITLCVDDTPVLAGDRAVVLDLGDGVQGGLLLGWDLKSGPDARPFFKRAGRSPVDEPLLATTASAISSVLRSARHLVALTEASFKLQAVIDHATDGIAVVVSSGAVLVWSPSMRAMVGDPPPQAVLAVYDDAVVGLLATLAQDPAAMAATLTRSLPVVRAQTVVEVALVGRHGDLRALDVSVSRIGAPAPGLCVLSAHDATEDRRVEKMKADFVATVSHELRTPITPIKGYARLLASRGDRMEPARRLHALQTIEDRADHLSRLVDDLLMASRVQSKTETSKLAVKRESEDLRNIVRQAATAFPLLSDRLEVRLPAQPVQAYCDDMRAVQCIANLIGNAEKYSEAGTPILVELLPESTGSGPRVVVTDHGRGIPPAELERIFERFHRVEDPFTMTTGGSGLGLFIARELARAMGGDITVKSVPGEGSTFYLSLPKFTGDAPSIDPVEVRALAVI